MASITIREVPDAARDELAARARRSGRSLQEYLRLQLIELAERPDAASHLATIRERKRLTGTVLDADTILGHRDADRR
jgi:plasmid stability protein